MRGGGNSAPEELKMADWTYVKKKNTLVITAGAYTALDSVGGPQTVDFGGYSGGGWIQEVFVRDDDNIKANLELWFFKSAPTVFADNVLFAPVLADLDLLLGVIDIPVANYRTINGNAVAWASGKNKYSDEFVHWGKGDIPNGILSYQTVCVATPTYVQTSAVKRELGLYLL
jgi:hypothetical protein